MITISADDKCTCGHERGEHSIHYCNGKECGCYYFVLDAKDGSK